MALCRVCNQSEATKFNHFGASGACASCRAFFMRSVRRKDFEGFQCKNDLNKTTCVIESKGRRSCKKCRFNKCLKVGMRVSYVLKTEEHCKQIMISNKASPKAALVLPFTSDERTYIKGLFDTFKGLAFRKMAEFYLANLNLMHFHLGNCSFGRVLTRLVSIQYLSIEY